jgi:hypothetical protein
MIHHIKNMRHAYEGVHTAGCIMAACAIRIVAPMLFRDDRPLLSPVISMAENVVGMDMVVISNVVIPMPAPNRMYAQESTMTVARPVMTTVRSRAKTDSRTEDACIIVSGRRRVWEPPAGSVTLDVTINGKNDQWLIAVFNGSIHPD